MELELPLESHRLDSSRYNEVALMRIVSRNEIDMKET